MMSVDLKKLRQQLQQQRKSVSGFEHQRAQQQVFQRLIRLKKFQQAHKVGIYLHAFGEVHTRQIIEYCFKQHKQVYLPMICTMNQQLRWVKISQRQYRNQRFSHHALGMQEPMASRGVHVSHLDLLILPLLACDLLGTRIGMGGGFYDRTLQHWQQGGPYPIGLAHDCQWVEHLPCELWDVPLPEIVTPTKVWQW